MSQVADNRGRLIEVEDLIVEGTRVYGFVEQYRKTYFEDHGLEWCLDEIIARGMAEIKRQVKTAETQAKNRVMGKLADTLNLTPQQAKEILLRALASQKQASNQATTQS